MGKLKPSTKTIKNTDTHVTISKSAHFSDYRLMIPIVLAEALISVQIIVAFAMKRNYLRLLTKYLKSLIAPILDIYTVS